jgi:UDP-glucuronate 4-epimerase
VRALVTGCAGFIGSHLTEALLGRGDNVVGIDCFNDNYHRPQKLRNLERANDWDAFDFVPIDLSRGDLESVVADVDVVFHLAAEPGVRRSWGADFERYVRNNVVATQHMLEAARAFPEKRFVYSSSSSIYGQAEQRPTPEHVVPAPHSPYGVTKLTGEHMTLLYHRNFGVDSVALRLFSVFGPRQRPDMAFNIFCRAALAGEEILIHGDGTQTRDFTFVGDVVAAFIAAGDLDGLGGEVFNIGGGSSASLNSAVETISELAGKDLAVQRQSVVHGDVRDTLADIAHASSRLGFTPQVSLGDGLGAEFAWVVEEHGRATTSR